MTVWYCTRISLPQDLHLHRRALSAGAHRLLTYALSEAGYEPQAMSLLRTAQGKPYLANCPLHLSLSHSGPFAVCALSDRSVGVDIERFRDVSPSLWRRYLANEPTEEPGDRYTAILRWTRYEALLKRNGSAGEAWDGQGRFTTYEGIPGYLLTLLSHDAPAKLEFVAERRLPTFAL